jgi:hypothetical protein
MSYNPQEIDDLLPQGAAEHGLTPEEEAAIAAEADQMELDWQRLRRGTSAPIARAPPAAVLARAGSTPAQMEKDAILDEQMAEQMARYEAELDAEDGVSPTQAEFDQLLEAAEEEVEDEDAYARDRAIAQAEDRNRRGWIHRSTGFDTNSLPGWRWMRSMTGFGRRTRRRKNRKRKPRKTRRKRKTRRRRRKRKTRRKRRKRRKRR